MEWRNASLRNEMTRLLRCTGGATGGHRINVVARCVATIAGAARIALRLLACCRLETSPQQPQDGTVRNFEPHLQSAVSPEAHFPEAHCGGLSPLPHGRGS